MGTRGEPRAALLGLAAACGYALTAALMKNAMSDLDEGAVEFFTTWHIYATAVAGVGSLFLLQNALQAGTPGGIAADAHRRRRADQHQLRRHALQ